MLSSRKSQLIRHADPTADRLPRSEFLPTLVRALTAAAVPSGNATSIASALINRLRNPDLVPTLLAEAFPALAERVVVSGPIESRLLIIGTIPEVILCSLGRPLHYTGLPIRANADAIIERPFDYVSKAKLSTSLMWRLTKPTVKLVALYHPEVFPLPRLALGISDIARAVRRQMIGQVNLCDMQLGKNLEDVFVEIQRERPDIIGISATFGQQDILEALLGRLGDMGQYRPQLVLGGSLAALNAKLILERYPHVFIAMGPGEATMCDVVRHFIGEIANCEITDVLLINADGRQLRTDRLNNREYDEALPELDLLDETLGRNGVMQLESSRGCSYACSFCPREHKGIWVGDSPATLKHILPELDSAYRKRPGIARKIFLVDEEFIGYRPDDEALQRAEGVCRTLKDYGFRFETSSRIDQVYRTNRDRTWHTRRIAFWRKLSRDGLDRCLFGVESGVDSILARFNKKTSSHQNVQALRILSACGVPRRCTYITFDPMMSMDELIETYQFQARRDILLAPLSQLSEAEIFDGIHDDEFIREHALNQPFFKEISYMLVSMECLIGSPYLTEVEKRGLAGANNLAMGRREASYVEPLIGQFSYYSQCWIDRNFSFDYTLKSVEKIAQSGVRELVRDFRNLIKEKSFELLGKMIANGTGREDLLADAPPDTMTHSGKRTAPGHPQTQAHIWLECLLNEQFEALRTESHARFAHICKELGKTGYDLIARELGRWSECEDWKLINAA
jgi:hypothetical protein